MVQPRRSLGSAKQAPSASANEDHQLILHCKPLALRLMNMTQLDVTRESSQLRATPPSERSGYGVHVVTPSRVWVNASVAVNVAEVVPGALPRSSTLSAFARMTSP